MNHGSNNRPAFLRRHLQSRSLKNNLARLATILVVGTLGMYLLRTGHAATVPVSSEAENGSIAGDAGSILDDSASGSKAVVFGSGIAPTDLQVFTGGNNIALVWNVPAQAVKNIQVWRNNAQIATVAPSSS